VANEAEDAHLRANASLLLGSLFEQRGDQRAAISFYRQAQELIPDEVGPYIVLALALSKAGRWDEAIAAQWIVVEMIPDDLVGWLLLGELHVKGGKLEEATQVYTAYEQRRKGLLDGLTLKQDGKYVEDEAERAACAEALAPAIDNGTALALMYALDSDPSPVVRERVATIMGEQRLLGYAKLLESKQATETDASVKEAIGWAIAEIQREPVETAPGPIPESLVKQVEAEVAAAKAASEGGAPVPEGGAAEPEKQK
jgi:tetratricopeptide (TPR) repeat protein